jgi:S-DNA-T family DNA segregation ATPase FtsK/SpoIIIE
MTATGRTVRAAPDNITDEPPPPNHLTDIHTVLHDQPRVRTQIVLTRLTELNPAVYEDWNFTDLNTALAHHGVTISKSHSNSVIRHHDISHALTHHSTNHSPNGAADAGN